MVPGNVGVNRSTTGERVFRRRRGTGKSYLRRRQELVDVAVGLFVRQGYRETTTRDIAQAAGWSVGTLYAFVSSKSEILYWICESIYEETEVLLQAGQCREEPVEEALPRVITNYFQACDARQHAILLIFQEINSLTHEFRTVVMQHEERMTTLFYELIQEGVEKGVFHVEDEQAARLIAHNVTVFGQMWAFRRFHVQKHYTLAEYTISQIRSIMRDLTV